MRNSIKNIIYYSLVLGFLSGVGTPMMGQEKERLKEIREAEFLLSDASEAMQKEEFPQAEADYRKSIALNPEVEIGKYNLGNAYYDKDKNEEAMSRFKQAATTAQTKAAKHKSFHNLGNTFMNAKMYQEAVEAYKSALRNNPKDDETRYNLALAKEMLEKNPPQGGGGDDDEEKDEQDQNEQEQNQENQDEQEKEGDDGDQQEDQDQGDEKDENKEGDQQEDKGNPNEPNKEQESDQQPQQPVPGQLSPQQVKNLLEAMNNEEKKVQDKINAKKQKGAKVRSNKDW